MCGFSRLFATLLITLNCATCSLHFNYDNSNNIWNKYSVQLKEKFQQSEIILSRSVKVLICFCWFFLCSLQPNLNTHSLPKHKRWASANVPTSTICGWCLFLWFVIDKVQEGTFFSNLFLQGDFITISCETISLL